ncbi:MAG: hypothetical protein ACN4GT_08690 [Gammaproteobacteria bacterium]
MTQTDHPARRVLSEIEIRGPEAVWVLLAHLYALLVPIVLVLVTHHHWDYLVATTHNPFLFYIAAVLMTAGSSFEVAQNAIDKWYLTPETGSANGVGFCDMLAFWLFLVGQAFVAVGLAGDAWWVVAIAAVAVVSFPVSYLLQVQQFTATGVVGILVAVLGYRAFGDPVIFLPIFLGFATMVFFTALLETGAQVLHGLTTVAASSGIWFFRWAVENGDAGTPNSWLFAIGILVVGAGIIAAIRPLMLKLPRSERVVQAAA